MIGWALRQLVIWSGAAVLFYVFVGDRLSLLVNPAPPMASGESCGSLTLPSFQSNSGVMVDRC